MDDIATLLTLLGLVAFGFAAFSFFKPLPKLKLATRQASALLAAGSVASCIVGGALMPAPPPAPAKPAAPPPKKSIKAATEIIETVEVSPPNLILKAYIPEAWDGAQYVSKAGFAAVEIGEAMKAGAAEDSPEIEYVLIQFETGGIDRLGNEVRIDFMNLVLPAADLRAANYKNLTYFGVLNLAHEVSWGQRAGADAIIAWCEKNLEYGQAFCLKAAS